MNGKRILIILAIVFPALLKGGQVRTFSHPGNSYQVLGGDYGIPDPPRPPGNGYPIPPHVWIDTLRDRIDSLPNGFSQIGNVTVFGSPLTALMVQTGANIMSSVMQSSWYPKVLAIAALIGIFLLVAGMWFAGRASLTGIIAYFVLILFLYFAFTPAGGTTQLYFRSYYLDSPNVYSVQVPWGYWLITGSISELITAIQRETDMVASNFSNPVMAMGLLGRYLTTSTNAFLNEFFKGGVPPSLKEVVEDFNEQCVEPALVAGADFTDKGISVGSIPDGIVNVVKYVPQNDLNKVETYNFLDNGQPGITCREYFYSYVKPSIERYLGAHFDSEEIQDPNDPNKKVTVAYYLQNETDQPTEHNLFAVIPTDATQAETGISTFITSSMFKSALLENLYKKGVKNLDVVSTNKIYQKLEGTKFASEFAEVLLVMTSRMLLKAMPLAQAVLLGFLFAVFPLILPFSMLPGKQNLLMGYFMSIAWVISWGIMFILIANILPLQNYLKEFIEFLNNANNMEYIVIPQAYITQFSNNYEIYTIVMGFLMGLVPVITYPLFFRGAVGAIGSIAGLGGAIVTTGLFTARTVGDVVGGTIHTAEKAAAGGA